MRRHLLWLAVLVLASFSFAGAQGIQTGTITGVVKSSDGQPLPGVTVSVLTSTDALADGDPAEGDAVVPVVVEQAARPSVNAVSAAAAARANNRVMVGDPFGSGARSA